MDIPHELCTIEIERGTVRLKTIEADMTYGGLIEGVPTAHLNGRIIERTVANAERRYGLDVWVVPPRRVTETGRYTGAVREYLPPVRCTGMFDGPPTPRSVGDWWVSSLAVVWFQDASDRLVHPDAADAMRAMPWDELAKDFTWDDC
ncbi:hypothetical protein [Actinomadura algeriensis]|uniref:ADP-ribose pyrophosphatase YjhB (NUDIX family) n=1 Tax=Actinomadura algeriensis TaxID=1679523 RepID=A0ABR9JK80_9ACTN|nr:hypothetical protein [Actinomadura algeriensis]MBE1530963.1 hypothetical protein [Actinomadura algeriensis]